MPHVTTKEFRDLGLIQEINRTFLHPLGFALEARFVKDGHQVRSEKGEEYLFRIQDHRDDPEGVIYAPGVLSQEKHDCVQALRETMKARRLKALGWVKQRIPRKK